MILVMRSTLVYKHHAEEDSGHRVGFRPIRARIRSSDRAFDAYNPDGIQGRNSTIAATARLGASIAYQGQCGGGSEELDDLVEGTYKFDVGD
jgi:hypothetical protein